MESPSQQLLPHLKEALDTDRFVKLVLSKYKGEEPELKRVDVRLVDVHSAPHLALVAKYETRDVTTNLPVTEGVVRVGELLDSGFRNAVLLTREGEVELRANRRGVGRIFTRRTAPREAPDREHNRRKQRLLDPHTPFLHELGVTDKAGQVRPTMADKWKQVNRYLEIFDHAWQRSALAGTEGVVRVVDFGAGKGYLTFALHHHLQHNLGREVDVVGIELRPHLVAFCTDVIQRLGITGLRFEAGDVHHFPLGETDILVALHACDTATDLALYSGLRAGAQMLLASPCCHKQLRPQMTIPEVLKPVLRHGIHLEREAEMVTDSLRALLLEEAGYATRLMEFIATEHTAKNKLLLATRRTTPHDPAPIRRAIDQLKAFYGLTEQALEMLLQQ